MAPARGGVPTSLVVPRCWNWKYLKYVSGTTCTVHMTVLSIKSGTTPPIFNALDDTVLSPDTVMTLFPRFLGYVVFYVVVTTFRFLQTT